MQTAQLPFPLEIDIYSKVILWIQRTFLSRYSRSSPTASLDPGHSLFRLQTWQAIGQLLLSDPS